MNNKKTDFYGKFKLNGKEYPFYYDDSFVTVIQTAWEYNEDFNDTTYLEKIVGVTNSDKLIVFLKCEFHGGSFKETYTNIIFSTKGFILFNETDIPFDCIEFESDAINTFYPPVKLFDRRALMNEMSYKIKSLTETTECFSTVVNSENIKMELGIAWNFSLRPEDKNIGEKHSVWRMKFQALKQSEELSKYYLYLLDFLIFVNFRKNIIIDNFTLYKMDGSSYNKVGEGKFFSNQSGYDSKSKNSITFEDLNADEMGRLFSCIAVQRKESNYNDVYIPQTSKKYRLINWIDWLNTALSFEGEYSRKYKNFKYQSDPNFASAKDFLLLQIDKKINESGVSINNKKNSAWSKFNHLIKHTDTRLEEKFEYLLVHFSDEISELKAQFLKRHAISDKINLSDEYADYRNHLAHGDIVDMSEANIVNFCLMRVFIYCLILERAEISKETRKKVVEKLFRV